MLDAARLEPLQLPDDLGRGAEHGASSSTKASASSLIRA
jgi:hypothetical protein